MSGDFDEQQYGWSRVKHQVKDIDRSFQGSIFQHNQLFQGMGHGLERRQEKEYGHNGQQ